jgi:hypothetical protein
VRIAARSAHDDLLLTGHCRGGSAASEPSAALSERVQQPHNQQKAGDAAQDDSRHCSGLGSGEVVVGGYYAWLDHHLLPLGDWLCVGRIVGNCGVVDRWLSQVEARVGGTPRRKAVNLGGDGLERIEHGGHGDAGQCDSVAWVRAVQRCNTGVVVSVWGREGARSLGETAVPECLGGDGRMGRR